ncbi:hypothetical protein HMPREF1137_1531 [Actinomyces sp. ICM39]|nr:hypothetical protein HMPREF1137_1531 [Actinomyces sp. ICM39]
MQHGINPTWQGGEARETGTSREYVTRPGPRPRNRAGSQVGARASSSERKLRRRGARARG